MTIINSVDDEVQDFAPIGTLFVILMTVLLTVLQVNTYRMSLAVGMGQTRKGFIICDTVLNFLHFLFSMLVIRLLYFIETGLYARYYRGYENGLPLEKIFSPLILGLITVAVVGIGLFLTMIKQRFGNKAFAFAWLICWMTYMLGSAAVSDAKEGGASILAVFGKAIIAFNGELSQTVRICILYVIVALFAVIGVLGLRRVEIRQ